MILTCILISNALIAAYAQRSPALKTISTLPMVRIGYVFPSNRTAKSNGVANLRTVESFTLIDATKDKAVRELENGLVIQREDWVGRKFSVRANTSTGTDRVEFNLTGPIAYRHTESKAPYALFGDASTGDYFGKELLPGEYTLTATPFHRSEKGIAFTVSFTVKEKGQGEPTIAWDKTLGGNGEDYFKDGVATPDGGFLLAGTSFSNVSGDKSENTNGPNDFWVIKIDAQHNKVWDKSYGGASSEDLSSVLALPDGGFLLGGKRSRIGEDYDPPDYWVVRIDKDGNKIWDRSYGGDWEDYLLSMISTQDGGYLLAGFSNSEISGDKTVPIIGGFAFDYWIVKIDASGNKIWDKVIGGFSHDILRSIAPATDGYLLLGASFSEDVADKTSPNKGADDYWVVKIDHDGNKIWDKTFGGTSVDRPTSVVSTPEGGYLIAGYSHSNSSEDKSENSKGESDFWLIKIDAAGNKIWDKTIGGNSYEHSATVVRGFNGGYLLNGSSVSGASGDKSEESVGDSDYWAVKIDDQGNVLWDKTLGGTSFESYDPYPGPDATCIRTLSGGYLLAGYSQSNASGDKSENSKGYNDYWLIEIREPNTLPSISLTLMNAQTDREIKELKNGDIISLIDAGTLMLDVRANITATDITKVVFDLGGPVKHQQTEHQPPYALFGNHHTNFYGRKLLPGNYTLKVTAFNQSAKIVSSAISFTVTDGFGITGFTLIDATTEKPLYAIKDGDEIDMSSFGNHKLTIRADTDPMNVEKVDMVLQGPICYSGVEGVYPYVLFGDITKGSSTDYVGRKFLPGSYTLRATPYWRGHKGAVATISFEVVKERDVACGRRIDVYPIPASDVVNISHAEISGEAFMTLMDFNGNVLVSQPLSKEPVDQLDVRQYRGTYYLKITGSDGLQIIRLVIE